MLKYQLNYKILNVFCCISLNFWETKLLKNIVQLLNQINPHNTDCNTQPTLQVVRSFESLCVCPVCIYFALFASKLWGCGQPQQPSSPADIQSGHVIMAAALISWPGYTWTLRSSATDNPPGGLGSARWLKEQLYRYMSVSNLLPFCQPSPVFSFFLSTFKPFICTVCPCSPQKLVFKTTLNGVCLDVFLLFWGNGMYQCEALC